MEIFFSRPYYYFLSRLLNALPLDTQVKAFLNSASSEPIRIVERRLAWYADSESSSAETGC